MYDIAAMSKILAGKPVADKIIARCGIEVERLRSNGSVPGLTFILVGDDAASHSYVARKRIACNKVGIKPSIKHLPAQSSTQDILAIIAHLNADDACNGILVQLPLPEGIATDTILQAVDPTKDVDGLHPLNMGALAAGRTDQLVACTPQGCMHLLAAAQVTPANKFATVVGRSLIVGRPLALLLLNAGATVTICHTQTPDLATACRSADILVVAVGCAQLITAAMVKPGATVLDVGINRLSDGRIVGDVNLPEVIDVAAHITPVPGGVGPMTVAMLMRNTIIATLRQQRARQQATP